MTSVYCKVLWEWKLVVEASVSNHWLCEHAGMLSCVQPFATPWTVAHQAPLSTGFSRQEYFREFPFPSPKDLPDPGVKPLSLVSPAPAGRLFTTSATWDFEVTQLESQQHHFLCIEESLSLAEFPSVWHGLGLGRRSSDWICEWHLDWCLGSTPIPKDPSLPAWEPLLQLSK